MPVTDDDGPRFKIVIGELADKQLDREFSRRERFQNLWEAIYWRLQRKPESGAAVPGLPEGYYLAKTPYWAPGGLPSLSVVYQIIDDEVHVISMRLTEKKRPTRT
jgi:hypothetical protein